MKNLIMLTLLFTFSNCTPQVNNSIVLVSVEDYDRLQIANQISILCSKNPKVISVDISFAKSYGGEGDRALVKALWSCQNLVMPTIVEAAYPNDERISISSSSAAEFMPVHARSGYVSVKATENELEIPRQFPIILRDDFFGVNEYHFSVTTAMIYDSLKTISFINSNQNFVSVDYQGGKRVFKKISASDVLNDKVTKQDIEGKIVMIGYLGPDDTDKFFSPLNKKMKKPDMYGLEYLATIVAQILDE